MDDTRFDGVLAALTTPFTHDELAGLPAGPTRLPLQPLGDADCARLARMPEHAGATIVDRAAA